MLNRKRRTVDFNQGIDARLICEKTAKALATINLSPVRLAFDFDGMEPYYRAAIRRLAKAGFRHFTNYVKFNFNDSPESLYRRMRVNLDLSADFGVAITGFPMRFIPIDDIDRQYVSPKWHWRYLRGIQCVLLATHGMVSPSSEFFAAAFGESYGEFLEILSMPDRYIIHREKYKDNAAKDWRKLLRRLSPGTRNELLGVLAEMNSTKDKKAVMKRHSHLADILEHYYPGGRVLRE